MVPHKLYNILLQVQIAISSLIQWLISLAKLKGVGNDDIYLAYDNMCNLMKLKVSKNPLPFPPPLNKLWLNVKKIIDVFHFQNHVSAECHANFSPVEMKQRHPDFNIQAEEQTFIWVHRFRHILCSMDKVHHLFYLHRMVL